jgi:hypothetical protein
MRALLRRFAACACLLLGGTAFAQQPGGERPRLPTTEVEGSRTITSGPESTFGSGAFPGDGRGAIMSDTQPVGSYNQPAWTTQRPFPTTRAYVIPEGAVELEQWARATWKKGVGKPEWRMLEELAIGLPCRFQLDIYERWHIEPNDDNHLVADHEGVQIEMRWALANWGVIPLNPTLYAEWIQRGNRESEPDKYELKLLLADEIHLDSFGCERALFFASNVILEQEVGGEKETEWAWSNAIGTTIIERKLMAGIEMEMNRTTVHGGRGDPEWEFKIGPSLQLRPCDRMFIDLVGLVGTTHDSPHARMFIVVGYSFGKGSGSSEGGISGPISTRGN